MISDYNDGDEADNFFFKTVISRGIKDIDKLKCKYWKNEIDLAVGDTYNLTRDYRAYCF